MCVNDCLVHGAEPIFFLDYFATGKLTVPQAIDVVKGVTTGCKQANCALIGGETAEMPGLYKPGEYDVAGFSVGVVERSKILPKTDLITPGIKILGVTSSGVHSNGLSLARKVVGIALNPETKKPYDFSDPAPFDTSRSLGDYLLTPTKIYIKSLLPSMQDNLIIAAAHITGGGLLENIPRVLPKNVNAQLNASTWTLSPILKWLMEVGNLESKEMARTFNCGIGFVLLVHPDNVAQVIGNIKNAGEEVFEIGSIIPGEGEVEILQMESTWVGSFSFSKSYKPFTTPPGSADRSDSSSSFFLQVYNVFLHVMTIVFSFGVYSLVRIESL